MPCDAMTTHYPTIADCIGNTPLVRLQRMPGKTSNTILVKLEGNNPGRLGQGPPGTVDDQPGGAAR